MGTIKTKEELKDKFIIEAIKHGQAIGVGDYKKANNSHKKLHAQYSSAKKQQLLEVFRSLLNENDENVRLWAATFTLEYKANEAEKVIKELMNSTTIVAVSAELTLRLWREGKLNLL